MTTSAETRAVIRVLEEFKEIDPEMTLATMLSFMYAVETDGKPGNRSEINQRLGMSETTVTRALQQWFEFKRPRSRGIDFLESRIDPEDQRYRVITLNRRGLDFVNKIKEAFNGTSER